MSKIWRKYLGSLLPALREVFRNPRYVLLAAFFAALAFMFAVWLPNAGLIVEVFQNEHTPLGTKLSIALNFLGGIRTNFSLLSASYTIAVAFLFGLNVAMIACLFKTRSRGLRKRTLLAGFGGTASGALGVACAACGSFILSSLLSFLGASAALAILPLQGGEFGILSVALLLWSLIVVSRKITESLICNPS